MKKIINQLEQYAIEILGIRVMPHPWEKNGGLPQYLRERYCYLYMDILGIRSLLLADIGEEEQLAGLKFFIFSEDLCS